jgi:hypothetical protein
MTDVFVGVEGSGTVYHTLLTIEYTRTGTGTSSGYLFSTVAAQGNFSEPQEALGSKTFTQMG